MLLPVVCPECGRRFWIETAIHYEERTFVGSLDELKKYVLKEQNVIRVWNDEDLAEEVRDAFRKLIKSGDSVERAIKIISEIYGIPILALEEFLSDLIEGVKIHSGRYGRVVGREL